MANFNEIRRYMLFVCQMVIIVSVILCALLNLSLDRAGTKLEIWISLLGTTVGNIMPTPKIKKPLSNGTDTNSVSGQIIIKVNTIIKVLI